MPSAPMSSAASALNFWSCRMEITEEQYAHIKDSLPVQRGNVSLTNLQVLNAILYVAEQWCLNSCNWSRSCASGSRHQDSYGCRGCSNGYSLLPVSRPRSRCTARTGLTRRAGTYARGSSDAD